MHTLEPMGSAPMMPVDEGMSAVSHFTEVAWSESQGAFVAYKYENGNPEYVWGRPPEDPKGLPINPETGVPEGMDGWLAELRASPSGLVKSDVEVPVLPVREPSRTLKSSRIRSLEPMLAHFVALGRHLAALKSEGKF